MLSLEAAAGFSYSWLTPDHTHTAAPTCVIGGAADEP